MGFNQNQRHIRIPGVPGCTKALSVTSAYTTPSHYMRFLRYDLLTNIVMNMMIAPWCDHFITDYFYPRGHMESEDTDRPGIVYRNGEVQTSSRLLDDLFEQYFEDSATIIPLVGEPGTVESAYEQELDIVTNMFDQVGLSAPSQANRMMNAATIGLGSVQFINFASPSDAIPNDPRPFLPMFMLELLQEIEEMKAMKESQVEGTAPYVCTCEH